MDFTVKNVSKRFGPTVAVDNVSVRFAAGEIRAIVGENGAGKSTLLKIVSGIHKRDSGEVCEPGDGGYVPDEMLQSELCLNDPENPVFEQNYDVGEPNWKD